MYFFIIEHCNRLWWKEKFWLPMEMTKDAIGIKNYRTYSDTLSDLIEWGFVKEIQKSKNQYSSCIIAIVENTKAHTKALDKALQKHSQKQVHGTVCINKQETGEPINNTTTECVVVLDFFNSTTWVNLKLTDKKKEQIKNRLKTFTIEEMQTAIKNRMSSQWHIDNGWAKDWDSLFCNDEKIDKMLNIKSEVPIKKVVRTFNHNEQ